MTSSSSQAQVDARNKPSVPRIIERVRASFDTRVRLIGLMAMAFASFFISSVYQALWCAGVLIVSVWLMQVPLRRLTRIASPFLLIMVMSFLANALVLRGGHLLFEWGFVHIWSFGVQMGLLMSARTFFALSFGVVLVVSTEALEMCSALRRLGSPLERVGVPVVDIALVLAIALRFVPLLVDEARRILRAQRSRGLASERGRIDILVRNYASLVVPMLASSLRHAERLSLALMARVWGREGEPTSLSVSQVGTRDVVFLVCYAVFITGFCILA